MPIGKVQTQILVKLEAMHRLTAEQRESIMTRPEDLTGEALEKILQDEFTSRPSSSSSPRPGPSASRRTTWPATA